ncbi:MAG: hypothetical protein AAFU77_16960 [Myxococcota bacterium]
MAIGDDWTPRPWRITRDVPLVDEEREAGRVAGRLMRQFASGDGDSSSLTVEDTQALIDRYDRNRDGRMSPSEARRMANDLKVGRVAAMFVNKERMVLSQLYTAGERRNNTAITANEMYRRVSALARTAAYRDYVPDDFIG